MLILYRLPGFGWTPSTFMEDYEELYEYAHALRHRLVVSTLAEWDYLKGLDLIYGKTLPLSFDPTCSVLRTNATEIRIMDL